MSRARGERTSAAPLEWAARASEARGVPALVEIIVDREVDASMGITIDSVKEFMTGFQGDREESAAAVAG